MIDPNSLLAIAGFVALLVIAVAGWMLRARLRTRSSLVLACALSLLALWPVISTGSTYLVLNYGNPSNPVAAVNWLVVTIEIFLPATLFLVIAASFLLSVKSVAPQPNSSFKADGFAAA